VYSECWHAKLRIPTKATHIDVTTYKMEFWKYMKLQFHSIPVRGRACTGL